MTESRHGLAARLLASMLLAMTLASHGFAADALFLGVSAAFDHSANAKVGGQAQQHAENINSPLVVTGAECSHPASPAGEGTPPRAAHTFHRKVADESADVVQ